MRIHLALTLLSLTACAVDDVDVSTPTTSQQASEVTTSGVSLRREQVSGDLYHYELVVPVGTSPNAKLRLHRFVREAAPYVPRHTTGGVMLMHGDFATTLTNFAPQLADPTSPVRGLAPYLAMQGFDVWGLDRRWTLPGTTDDVSDFGEMGVVQETEDLRQALALARSLRAASGAGSDKLTLIGFSHGAQLAYTYAAVEGARPAAQRHVKAIVPIDMYAEISPADPDLRAAACDNSAFEYELVAGGEIDSPNTFVIRIGERARTIPDELTPIGFLAGMTNREVLRLFLGQTYELAPYAPLYHLLAPSLDAAGAVTGFTETSEAQAMSWTASAPPHQSMLEAADLDALWCGSTPAPIAAPLSQIRVPVYYLGAAGGVGEQGLYTTTRVSSPDVTTRIVHRFGPARRAEDFGHGDLLYATDAPTLAWRPLAAWLAQH